MASRQVWFSLPSDPWLEEDEEDCDTLNLLTQSAQGQLSLPQQTYRPREISRLGYHPSINPGPVPRLNLQEKPQSVHTFNLSARSSLSFHSAQSSQVSIDLESASLSQFSFDGSSSYHPSCDRREELKDTVNPNRGSTYKISDNMDGNCRSSVDSGPMNRTGSTNDSHHVDSSQTSPVRGLSSDEGSGWKSETTETSEGNLSLSQYAIGGDQSEDDSPHHSAPEEFLTSAISEVSKDFISGNFSPSKYPGASGESDSLSDGDNPGHVSGAVYARYPESATGLSDCEWNPYATESDNNYTPRSNVSESATVPTAITTTVSMTDSETLRKGDKLDEIYAQQLSRNVPDRNRHSPSSPSATDSGHGSVKSSYREEELNFLQPSASYVLYSSENKSGQPKERLPAVEKDSMTAEQLRSGQSKASETNSGTKQKLYSRPEPLGQTDECLYAKRTSSRDPAPVHESRKGSESRKNNTGEYLPVDERDRLLSNLHTENPTIKRLSDPGVKSEAATSSLKERLSDGGLSQSGGEDGLSQRVAKLLSSANELGSSLHQSLYNKEALGLDDRENFPKYKFSPVRSQYHGLSSPSPTLGNSGQEDLTRSAKSMTSDVSLRSSLGEEVAKLLARTEYANGVRPDEDVSAASEPSSKTFKPIPMETNSGAEMDSRKKEAKEHTRHGSEDSQKSEDSLDRKVKEILQRTSYVETKELPRREESAALDYSRLQRDLQEIQNSLPVHLNHESSMDASGDREALRDSLKISEKSFVSETESRSGGKKLLWDHGADLGYDDSGRFQGTLKSDTETVEGSPGTVDKSFESSGKSSQRSNDDTEKGGDTSDVVSDQLEVEIDEIRISNVATDVEEIIAKYQKKREPSSMEPQFEEDTSGLASRVFNILTNEHPQKQATGILENVVKEERKLIDKMADLPRMDSSYHGYDLASADSSFAPKDTDIRKQLEWSQMSSLDYGHLDKTALSEMSFKTGLPFSALGNAKTFLSSQLQKMSEQTFNHSIELRTPNWNVLECYTLYGAERNRGGPQKEAWPPTENQGRQSEADRGRAVREDADPREMDPLSNHRFFLNSLDTTPTELRPRRYSDPREFSPEGRGTREGHNRSKSEDDKPIVPDHDLMYDRNGSRPLTSTRGESGARPKNPDQRSLEGTPPDTSPRMGGTSPADSDLSSSSVSRRREGPKLRPYRPPGSREVYYTETDDSVADSVTTMESTHTGSDDAVGPYIPSQHLGSRQDGHRSSGIYGNRSNDVVEDALSTIEEKSVMDERERYGGINPSSQFMRDSGLEHSSRVPMATDRAPSIGSDHPSNRSGHSRASDPLSGLNSTAGAWTDRPRSTEDALYEDSRMSMTTRSDPGDQFATPRRVRDVSKLSGHAHASEDNSSDNIVRSKSRSETDLVSLSPEGKQVSSSPATKGRLMDLSNQPSPIPPNQSAYLSSSFQGALNEMQQRKQKQQDYWTESVEEKERGKEPLSRESYRRSDGTSVPYSSRNQEDEVRRGILDRRPATLNRGSEYGRKSPIDDVRRRGIEGEDRGHPQEERKPRGMDSNGEDYHRSGEREVEIQEIVRSRPQEEEMYDYTTKKQDKSDRSTPNQYDRLGDIMSQYQSRPLEPGRESLDYNSRPKSTDPGRNEFSVRSSYNPNRGNSDSRSGRLQNLDFPKTSTNSRFLADDNAQSDRRQDVDVPRFYSRNDYDTIGGQRSNDRRPLELGTNLSQAHRESGFYSGQSESDKEYRKTSPAALDVPEVSGRSALGPSISPVSQPSKLREDTPYRPLEPGRHLDEHPLETGSGIQYGSENVPYQQRSDLDFYMSSLPDSEASKRQQRVSPENVATEKKRSDLDMQGIIERERGRPLDRGQDYLDMFISSSIDRDTRGRDRSGERQSEGRRSRDRSGDRQSEGRRSRDRSGDRQSEGRRSRERSAERSHRFRSPANRSSERELREYLVDGEVFTELPQVPDEEFEDMLRTERLKAKKELEMMRQLNRPKGGLLTEEEEKTLGAEFDTIPPSKKAQALRETLEKDRDPSIRPNINDLWRKFQEMNETHSDSSMNTSRMETLTSLLQNPTKHVVQRALDDRTYQKVKERRVVQGLTQMERENQAKERENQHREVEKIRMEKQKRRQTLSEEEVNGSYAEILAKQKKMVEAEKKQKNKENKMKGSKNVQIQEVKKLGDSADTLYSIPEDTSFESSRGVSPNVMSESQKKVKRSRQKNVIDPLMVKLRDKVERQKNKIDVEKRKEMKRMEKLQKLEMLLGAKKKGKLSDRAISAELENVSTTSVPQSDDSTTFLNSDSTLMEDSDDYNPHVLDSTSSKDSSIEIQRTRIRKPKDNREFQKSAMSVIPLDDSESQSDIIIVRRPKTKERKDRINEEAGHVSRSQKKHRDRELKKQEKRSSPVREKFHLETSPVRSRKLRDIGTMYPSPIIVSPPTLRRRPKEVAMKSEAVQTANRSLSPSYSQTMVIPVPLMSPESQRKTRSSEPSRRGKTAGQRGPSPKSSPNRSNLFPREYTPPRSKSPSSRLTNQKAKAKSYGEGQQRNRSTSPPKSKMFVPESDSEYEKFVMKTPPKNKMFTPETPDDEYAARMRDSPKGLTWYIPMGKETKPWKKPLRERQAHAVRSEPWQPSRINDNQWRNIVARENLDKSRDTKFDLNPDGKLIENKENAMEESDEDNPDTKPLNKMTLQDAFKLFKQNTISHVRERQKRVTLAAEERKLTSALQAEREQLFSENKKKEANPDAHPYSENLHVPKKRSLTKQEIKERTAKSYKKLAEVVQKKKQEKIQEDYALNRLKAKVFNRRIQRHVLKKSATLG